MIGRLMGGLMGGFVAILVGVSLYPVISEQVNLVDVSSQSPLAQILLGLIPVLFGICILAIGVGVVVGGLRDSGLMGEYESYSDEYEETHKDTPEEEKPHKQTYLEYVQERKKVEGLMKNA